MAFKEGAKRIVDVLGSGVGLVVLSPIMAGAALAIGLTMGRPIFFRQQRPGLGGEPFSLIKFRTMWPPDEGEEMIGNDEGRITKVGGFLRASSIDELPTLWNVLRGDMSLVGPRPLLMDYLPYFSDKQNRRHEVKPGITGWAQVNGRNAIGWDKKLDLDTWYVDNRSFWLDLKILWLTIAKVVKRDDITHEGHVAMPRFDEYVKEQRSGT